MLHRVALIYDSGRAFDLKVITGVAAYLQEGASWSVYIEETALRDQRLPDRRSWRTDGIIADFDDQRVAKKVIQSGLPSVGFGGGYGWYPPDCQIPYFFTNNEAIAKMAVEHFLERGFDHFAFCGYTPTPVNGWSNERERAFRRLLEERGFRCDIYRAKNASHGNWAASQNSLRTWLQALPKPVALMAANDDLAHRVLETCRAESLQVPERVAVIGVDNDELLCKLSTPLLSSIEQGAHSIGYQAASLLDQIMSGQKPRKRRMVADPLALVTRRSSDVVAVQDPVVSAVSTFVREHACEGIKVRDVVTAFALSRSGLDQRFRTVLGCTLYEMIRHIQLGNAQRLIRSTSLPFKEVAYKCGFKSVQHMTTLFSKAFGHTPGHHRAATRGR